MTKVHTEATFEAAIVAHLVASRGWARGDPDDFDRQVALIPNDLFACSRATQPESWV